MKFGYTNIYVPNVAASLAFAKDILGALNFQNDYSDTSLIKFTPAFFLKPKWNQYLFQPV